MLYGIPSYARAYLRSIKLSRLVNRGEGDGEKIDRGPERDTSGASRFEIV